MDNKTRAELLRKAAGEIRRRGWTQLQYADSEGHVCLAGALLTVCEDHVGKYLDLREVIYEELQMTPVRWNDSPGRTSSEVLDLLESMANKLETETVS